MKRILKTTALAMMIAFASSFQNNASAQYYDNQGDVTYQTFYDELSPYGQWIDNPDYGYVWAPDAGPDFRPYSTNGHWVWSDNYEWMWVSDYDWGWAPFHYGRWEEDPYYGWIWVPGYEWSPAWVAWRDGGDYYGWAPLRPGISISINFNIGSYSPPYDYWCFAPRQYITSPNIFNYCVDRRQNVSIINYTTIIVNNNRYNTNYGFRSGPNRYEAERYCGRISPVNFRNSSNPGRTQFRNNEVSFYRPNVRKDNDRGFAPRQFNSYDRNNDNRMERHDNGFRRNDNNSGNRNNDQVRERRNDHDFRQPRNDAGANGQNNHADNNRISRPQDRNTNPGFDNNNRGFDRANNNYRNQNAPDRQPAVRNNDQQPRFPDRADDNNGGNRTIPNRLPDVRNNDQPQRRPSSQFEKPQPVQQPRTFSRPVDNNSTWNTPYRQPETRNNDQPARQPVQQPERRQEPRQQPARQMDRRDDGIQQQNSGDNNNGNSNSRNSRKRF